MPTPEPASDAPAGPDGQGVRTSTAIKVGAAVGIGSAAIVAALLYANRARKTAAPKPSLIRPDEV